MLKLNLKMNWTGRYSRFFCELTNDPLLIFWYGCWFSFSMLKNVQNHFCCGHIFIWFWSKTYFNTLWLYTHYRPTSLKYNFVFTISIPIPISSKFCCVSSLLCALYSNQKSRKELIKQLARMYFRNVYFWSSIYHNTILDTFGSPPS